jgi:thiamine-phosphate diphosphorylase
VTEARRLLGPNRLIGASVHSVAAARAAEVAGTDYLIAGTIFPSPSHPGGPVAGPDLLRRVRADVRIPLLAIGGITAAHAPEALAAGADGLAVISAILSAPDPGLAAQRLRSAIDTAWATLSLPEQAQPTLPCPL